MRRNDVYAFGVLAPSRLYLLDGPFPQAEGYAEIQDSISMTGGEACNSSLVLAKWGVSVALDGNWLGQGGEDVAFRQLLHERKIDIRFLRSPAGYPGIRELVFSHSGTRTIFGNYTRLILTKRQWNTPNREAIAVAKIVSIDPFFGKQSAQCANLARKARVPYVTVDCSPADDIARYAEAIVVSGEFREREYADRSKTSLFEEYLSQCRGLVVFTSGHGEILYGRPSGEPHSMPAFRVEPVDTAGAGDSFRAGVVYGLLRGWEDERIIRFSAATAALICQSFPGVLHSPTLSRIKKFLQVN